MGTSNTVILAGKIMISGHFDQAVFLVSLFKVKFSRNFFKKV